MPWQEQSKMELRRIFIEKVELQTESFKDLCEEFGISRKTGYKWYDRYQEKGDEGLQDQSHRPHQLQTSSPPKVEKALVELRQKYSKWGVGKLCSLLEQQGYAAPPLRTAHRILVRHGLVSRKKAEPKATQAFEREAPNQLWQIDHKAAIHLNRWKRVVPFVVLDDHSRFLVGLYPQPNKGTEATWQSLWTCFQDYGLPEQILSDNDMVFHGEVGPSQIEARLMRLGIRTYHGAPYHPQTQGKVERLNGTLQWEVLEGRRFKTLQEVQEVLQAFQDCYNYQRPHESLGQKVPASRYQPSGRPCPKSLPPMEYQEGSVLRKVGSRGSISWKGLFFLVGRGLTGEWVQVQELNTGVEIYYGPFYINYVWEGKIRTK